MRIALGAVALGSMLLWAGRAGAEAVAEQPDLSDLSIEQLAQIKVTSASKTEEPLSEAPAALYVVTGQDIEDSGVTSRRFGRRPTSTCSKSPPANMRSPLAASTGSRPATSCSF